ncbi:MAG TPA: GNAT family N-acetyltransferase [Pseudonocardiaceae bacterium]|nr:GNAT family N-acetyltransferase [Pseudonocardiaceae bacterium]
MSAGTPTAARVDIVTADRDGAALAADIIADAFWTLDVSQWLVPENDQRRAVLERNMLIWTEHAAKHGMIHLTADQSGVAVWFPVSDPPPEPDDYAERLEAACGPWTERFRMLDEAFEQNQPEDPHHHLAFLAIRPGQQGRGIGTALLNHHHEMYPDVADYLEAASWQSRQLYLRHHFDDHGPFYLPDGPPMWSMWRPAEG